MTKHYNDHTTLEERALDYVESATGAAPGAAPALAADGVDCRELGSSIVKVTADQATGGGVVIKLIPWIYGRTRDSDGAITDGWTSLPPMFVNAIVGEELTQEMRVSCESADRLYLQIVPDGAGLAWVHAEAFAGLRLVETQPVTVMGLREIIAVVMSELLYKIYILLCDVKLGVDDTYYYYVDRDKLKSTTGLMFTIDPGLGSVVCTVEWTGQDDGTAKELCQYDDITLKAFGVANITTTSGVINEKLLSVARYLRVKVVVNTGGLNDASWRIIHIAA